MCGRPFVRTAPNPGFVTLPCLSSNFTPRAIASSISTLATTKPSKFMMQTFPNPTYSLVARRFSTDEEIPEVRSIVKLRLPNPIAGPGSLLSVSAVSGATQANYHSAIVRYSIPDYARECIVISVWPIPAYSAGVVRASSPAAWMRDQPQLFRDANIPFPCHHDTQDPRPPPSRFGAPITLPQFRDGRPCWILMESQTFDLPFTKAVRPPLLAHFHHDFSLMTFCLSG